MSITFACVLAWTSHAPWSLSAAESELGFVDPPSRVELRTIDEATALDILLASMPEVVEPETQENQNTTLSASELTVNIMLPAGSLPENVAVRRVATSPARGDSRLAGRWAMTEHHWSATCLRHRPLYFEEVNLERYGYTPSYTFQPLISAARFFATIPALPYKMVLERPRQCIYTLGHYRPGSCAPRHWHRLPVRAGAGLVEASIVVGLVFLIP